MLLTKIPFRLLLLFCLLTAALLRPAGCPHAAPLSGCANCHTDADRIDELTEDLIVQKKTASVSELQEGKGCAVAPSNLDLFEKVLVKPAFLETAHGKVECSVCHLGNPEVDDPAEAHQGMLRYPSLNNRTAACGPCHAAITATAQDSPHMRPDSLLAAMEKRCSPEQWRTLKDKQVPEKHCLSCHTSTCGSCHVSRPMATGGGLSSGHLFKKTPDFIYQCLPCHGAVAQDYTGEQSSGDLHYRDARMVCTDCHGGNELHAAKGKTGHQPPGSGVQCADCHQNLEQGAVRQHAIHKNTVHCTVCHSQAYPNCGSCHMGTDENGLPYSQSEPASLQLKIGLNSEKNAHPDEAEFVLVRQVPVRPDSYESYLGEDLARFNALPTFKRSTTPHNVQRKTWQNAHCNNCHGNRKLFLTAGDLPADDRAANRAVIVPDERIPAAIPDLAPMTEPAPVADPLVRVSPAWLHDHLGDDDLLILDVRDVGPYEESHIPGAYNLCFCHARTSNVAKPPYMMHTPEELAAAFLQRLPLTPEKRVVIYGSGSAMRGVVFVALERIGHQKVSFMDGDMQSWEDLDYPTAEGPAPEFKPLAAYPVRPRNVLIDSKTIQRQMETGELVLLDARTVSQFMGHEKRHPAHHAGRIPGAVSLPLKSLLNPAGEFRSPAELTWILKNIHVYPEMRATLVTSCNTNALAAELYMMLRSLGYQNLLVHDGSWIEWAEMTK